VVAVLKGAVPVVLVALIGCAPSATVDPSATDESFVHLRSALAAYESAGFLAGPPDFPVVGRAVALSGPPDSVFVGFAASIPPSALRFARDGATVAARYQVTMLVRRGSDTLARVDRREIVRVADFSEASSREPRVLFQRFVPVPSGSITLDVTVRELAARRQTEHRFRLETRDGEVSEPLVAYRAERRPAPGEPPDILLNGRNTVTASERSAVVFLEGAAGRPGPATLRVERGGAVLWSDTVALAAEGGGVPSAVAALPVHLLPPGRATLRVRYPGGGIARVAPLYIGLAPEWVFPSWEEALAHLVYALDSDTLEAWKVAPPGEQTKAWRRFQERTDPDSETPPNEFLDRYFERMGLANERFDEPGRAGWETDRGEVLVKLGEPDRQRFVRPERQNDVPRIEWEYEESLPSRGLIVFEDSAQFGVFVMTPRSRIVLRRLVQQLAEAAGA